MSEEQGCTSAIAAAGASSSVSVEILIVAVELAGAKLSLMVVH